MILHVDPYMERDNENERIGYKNRNAPPSEKYAAEVVRGFYRQSGIIGKGIKMIGK